jgi:heat shock protein HslJ
MKNIILTATLIATIFIAGCNDSKKTTGSTQKTMTREELKLNGSWELNYISGPKIAFEGLFPNKKPLIVFDLPKAEVNGNGGCNGYSCKVKVDGNKISFGDALSTMMACEGNGEPLYFKTLKTVTAYSITDNILTMLMDDIAVMRFIKK